MKKINIIEKDDTVKIINGKEYRKVKEEKTFAEKLKENSKRFAKRK